jgi:hypothetical protein
VRSFALSVLIDPGKRFLKRRFKCYPKPTRLSILSGECPKSLYATGV